MPRAQETILEIDLTALAYNYNFLRSKLRIGPQTKFLAVVKSFGYGSDAVLIANHLEKLKVDYFAVAYTREGITLREAGLYNKRILDAFIAVSKTKKQIEYPVHIKFNTGLNRLGFSESNINYIVEKIQESSQVKVKSLFSHLAASEDLDEKVFTLNQIGLFKKIITIFEQKIGYKTIQHQLNTSGILNYAKEAQFDMVRAGIGLYGFANDPNITAQLKNVMSLKSIISQIHSIKKGETVGYNRAHTAQNFIKTATIPIGHADGIHRALGNGKGYVTIHGKKAPIIGNVCMDMIMVNITGIECMEGDEVIIFNSQKTINELAKKSNTISYEILTAISQRVKRFVK